MLNVKVDRRHDRRALTTDEFARLLEAAMTGKVVESISGPNRAMLYVLSAWTGYRKKELGSLTPRSLQLDADPPTITVNAAYSKRRRQDVQVLHPEVATRLREWINIKRTPAPDDLLFPVSGKVPGGTERKTAKMMRVDLEAARTKWLIEAASPEERKAREGCDFLEYCDHDGLFADFHSNRHTFITSLEQARVSPPHRPIVGTAFGYPSDDRGLHACGAFRPPGCHRVASGASQVGRVKSTARERTACDRNR
jgi:integrase